MTLRKPKTEEVYQKFMKKHVDKCLFCREEGILKEFKFWRVRKNDYPYDKIARKHDLLYIKRHEPDINQEELNQLDFLKKYFIPGYYDCILENVNGAMTIPGHYHVHLIKIY